MEPFREKPASRQKQITIIPGALERDGKRLIVSLLACGWPSHKNYKWADAAKLLNYRLESYTYRDVLDHSWNPGQIEVADGVYDGMLQVKSSARLTAPYKRSARSGALARSSERDRNTGKRHFYGALSPGKERRKGRFGYVFDRRDSFRGISRLCSRNDREN